ncbi:putative polyketide biosynthesis enoyl-CoA hydratase PksH [Dictyobacter vulcani]|uniref:Putative polyketide biosynthesis enoyl-CoA hydratase PksH n=1 Tax=Dictyobacter vulcani TaxID=2607529 RepID=A0A5J4KQQ5_9CHLR|nr:enoyl-CoA hydratase/isomerase [Dictyobacter vulcani]GER89933.1 putative polyketide biosynthesis enoyl-CoA hydratase PksH [Dictyobacter vulcani]
MNYQTLQVRFQQSICYIQFNRPEANNTINDLFIEECLRVLAICEARATIVVLEGSPEVFCLGADFQGLREDLLDGQKAAQPPEPLYDAWLQLATGSYITISHVRGKVNAGGIGFVAASDIVIADESAQFSLSEMLFGLFPACVLPFLIRRIGFQKAHYLTLMTQPILVQQAQVWGLVDAYDAQSDVLLRKHLLRLRRLSKPAITRYKSFAGELYELLYRSKPLALASNQAMFADPHNQKGIIRFVETGQFPWESE